MNKQRKVLITITYNEMGIIIDTKTEELGSSAQHEKRTEERTETHARDSISRQQAIERFDYIRPRDPMTSDYAHGIDVGIALCKVAIREQPPAQPEQHIDADGTLWITVTDIERVTRVIVDEDKSKFCRQFYMDAKPEQRTGHWHITDAYPHNVYCSECHKRFAQTHWAVWEDGSLPRNFCPNCGAKMTEGDAE